MINLSTPSKELLDELWDDYTKADYWLTKKLGGMKKQSEIGHELCRECITNNKEFATSDYVEYISPKGNRWIVFVSARFYDDHFYTTPMGFCYYETYGSVGAFVPTQCGDFTDKKGCIIFTSHFFLRMCDRLGVKVRSRSMIKRFVEYVSGMVVGYRGEGNHGKHEVDVRLPASIGRGRLREDSLHVVEVNTFLRDCELTNKQLEETKSLRECSSKVKLQSLEHLQLRIKKGDVKGVYEHVKNNLLAAGYDEFSINVLSQIPAVAKAISERMGLKLEAEETARFLKQNIEEGKEFAEWRLVILSKKATEEEKNRAFWQSVVLLITHFNPSADTDDIIDEGFKYTEELTKKIKHGSKN